MKCIVCGQETYDSSNYCQLCSQIMDSLGVLPKNVSELIPQIRGKQHAELFGKIQRHEFKEVEIQPTFAQSKAKKWIQDGDLEEVNGKLRINIAVNDLDECLPLIVALASNELDSIHGEIVSISRGQHNDRTAAIESAFEFYQNAKLTSEPSESKKYLDMAEEQATIGRNKLKQEIKDNLKVLEGIPRNLVLKLFCGISRKKATESLMQIQDAYSYYFKSIKLSIKIGSDSGNKKKVRELVKQESQFWKELIGSKGYVRLVQIDDDNEDKWKENVRILPMINHQFEQLETGSEGITVKLLEEKNE